ncbi:hypothetical protein A3A93_06185 [Candidatus Roizmanbacteria bacterium RIFCSPLOWO2_01_FULL_38_12]|uniref:Uncharacterized protein n=1 Tax=Candidatus Roizmanbacteria bacterium RIFCSPLOWO2_01_FULL_38_12 TaxID=1802061 RepID=A0A1F7ITX9_9BACT|nr:MAG: hypothetical protein A3A93_06185 [Candidatus Roizmanbacteria bacterium RIFCSPLOWO2_01_FULL_38_12]
MENILAIIEYESEADYSFLIKNIESFFSSYENYGQGTSVMLALINADQQAAIVRKGLNVQVVENSPDIQNYVLLYHPVENQGSKLADLGEVYMITKNHSLVRIKENTTFSQTGEYAKFMMSPLQIVTPEITRSNQTISPTASASAQLSKYSNFVIIGIIIGVVLIVTVAIVIFRRLRKS